MKQVITLFEDRLLLRQVGAEKVSKGGIILPDTAQEKPCKGVVIDKGPEVPEGINIGDEVMFGKYAGSEVELNHDEVMVVRFSDIMGVLHEVEELPASYKKP